MKEIEIKVNGMECNGCENRICNALKTIDSVDSVYASYESGIVKVKTKENIDISILTKKIEDIGFKISKEN